MKKTLKGTDTTKSFKLYVPFSTKAEGTTEEGEEILKIKGWANYCGNLDKDSEIFVDHCGDVMVPSGFDLSVWNKNPQILWNHDRTYTIGKGIKATKKKDGLEIEAELHQAAMEDEDWYRVKNGLVSYLSVGFRTVKAEMKEIDGKNVYFITKSMLYECSVVSIPMNSESGFSLIKSLNDDAWYAEETEEYLSDEDQNISEKDGDVMKVTLRDMLPAAAAKSIEDSGFASMLDEEKDISTKQYVDTFKKEYDAAIEAMREEIKELKALIETKAAGEDTSEQPAEEDASNAEESADDTKSDDEETSETKEESEEDPDSVKSLIEELAKLKALVAEEK